MPQEISPKETTREAAYELWQSGICDSCDSKGPVGRRSAFNGEEMR